MNDIIEKIAVFTISLMIAASAGCKKGAADFEENGVEIYGTAAVGLPVAGTVSIKGANGRVSYASIRSDGTYTVDVSALEPPFIVYVEGNVGGTSIRIYSTIDGPGRANVTPATNLVMALALGQDPEAYYPPDDVKNDGKEIPAPPSQSELIMAIIKIQMVLSSVFPVLNVPDDFNIMNGEFLADGSGFDQILDLIKMDVDTTSTGEVVVNVSDALSGTTYYEENTNTGVVINNTGNMGTAVTEAAADQQKMLALANTWITYIMSTSETDKRTILQNIYAEDYLNRGMNKTDSINDELMYDRVPDGLTSVKIDKISIAGTVEDGTFTGGKLTNTVDRTINYSGGSVTIPAGTVFTFNSGTLSSLKSGNYKAVKIFYTITAVWDGVTNVFTQSDYLVQQTAGGSWKYWGDRTLGNSNFNTTNKRIIYASYDSSAKTYTDKSVKFSGYSLWFNDEWNQIMNFGINNFGLRINAILVVGQGMKHSYTDDGKKGMILVRPSSDSQFKLLNNVADTDGVAYNYCISGRDLDVSQITSPELTVIAMYYDTAANTFTPLYSWKCNGESAIPLAESQLSDSLFPSFTNFISTDINDYSAFDSFPWNLTLNWTAPSDSSLSFQGLGCWFDGRLADGLSWASQECGDKGLLNSDSGNVTQTTYNFTMDYGVTGGTFIRSLDNITFSLRYGDNTVKDGVAYETEYRLTKKKHAVVNGTITGAPSSAGKRYVVVIDNDMDVTDGFVSCSQGSTDNTGTINYSMTEVPAGDFNVYCIVYNSYNGTYPVSTITGDYIGYYSNTLAVPAKGSVSCDIALSIVPGATVSGNITVPDIGGKNYLVILDTDTDYTVGSTAVISGTTVSGNTTIPYTIPNVPVGAYYIYCVIYNYSTYYGYYTVPVYGDIHGTSTVGVSDTVSTYTVDFTATIIQPN